MAEQIYALTESRFKSLGHSITFSKDLNLSANAFMLLGEVTTSTTNGYPLPHDLTLETVAISRTDSDSSSLEILRNGSVIATVATAATSTVDDSMSVACNQGDIISVRNISGGAVMSNTVCTLWLEGIL